jgi:DNA-binding protein Fis
MCHCSNREFKERSRGLTPAAIAATLERSHGNQSQAAHLLGLNRDQVRYRIEKFGLQV